MGNLLEEPDQTESKAETDYYDFVKLTSRVELQIVAEKCSQSGAFSISAFRVVPEKI